jgi:phospholipid-binding lipoprotein MlaA
MSGFRKSRLAPIAALILAGCATNGDPRDPLEPVNRAVYAFNDTIDRAALEPLASGYRAVTPRPVQTGLRNFYSNLDDVTVFANSVLQLRLAQSLSDLMRIAFNTTFGFFGFIDLASEMGLKKHNEDFGQTLGYWGLSSGPYLVLPFFGPSSVRDGVGLVVDNAYTDVVSNHDHIETRNYNLAARIVTRRADLLDATKAMAEAALDEYEYSRDFYLERREALAHDARPQQAE